MRHIIPISGKDSLATALVQMQAEPDLPYEYVFNPTGAELPEVLQWIDRVQEYLGAPIVRIGADLFEIIEDYNYFLPNRRARYCTKLSKIEPFEKWIGMDEATVYYGIRADENRGGYDNARYPHIIPKYPLTEHGIALEGVYRIVTEAGLKPPMFFWQSVYDAVAAVLHSDTMGALAEWQRDVLFAGRSRANCFMCFNQAYYEWVWLLETYPDQFWQAEAMEHKSSEYTWNNNGKSLKQIAAQAGRIKRNRIKAIIKTIRAIRYSKDEQVSLWDFSQERDLTNFFNQTSCGLFCAK